MARIFAYIAHKAGVPDDSAAQLATAAEQIDPASSPTAVITGCGADLDAACNSLRASYAEIWKVSSDVLAYPNAELVRQALVKILPLDSILLLAHEHFGIDLAPGLSIKMNSALCLRRDRYQRTRRQLSQRRPPGIRRTGERSCSLRHFLGRRDHRAPGCIQTAGK